MLSPYLLEKKTFPPGQGIKPEFTASCTSLLTTTLELLSCHSFITSYGQCFQQFLGKLGHIPAKIPIYYNNKEIQ